MDKQATEQERKESVERYKALLKQTAIYSRDGYAYDAPVGYYYVLGPDGQGDGPQVMVHCFDPGSIALLEKFEDPQSRQKISDALNRVVKSNFNDMTLLDDPDIKAALDLRIVATRTSPTDSWYTFPAANKKEPEIYSTGQALMNNDIDDLVQIVAEEGAMYYIGSETAEDGVEVYTFKNQQYSAEIRIHPEENLTPAEKQRQQRPSNPQDPHDRLGEFAHQAMNTLETEQDDKGGRYELRVYPGSQKLAKRFVETDGAQSTGLKRVFSHGMTLKDKDGDTHHESFNDALKSLNAFSRNIGLNLWYLNTPYTARDYLKYGPRLALGRISHAVKDYVMHRGATNIGVDGVYILGYGVGWALAGVGDGVKKGAEFLNGPGRDAIHAIFENRANEKDGPSDSDLPDRLASVDFSVPMDIVQEPPKGQWLKKTVDWAKQKLFGDDQSLIQRRGMNILDPELGRYLGPALAHDVGILPENQILVEREEAGTPEMDDDRTRKVAIDRLVKPFYQQMGVTVYTVGEEEIPAETPSDLEDGVKGDEQEGGTPPDEKSDFARSANPGQDDGAESGKYGQGVQLPRSISLSGANGVVSHYILDTEGTGRNWKAFVRYAPELETDNATPLNETEKAILDQGHAIGFIEDRQDDDPGNWRYQQMVHDREGFVLEMAQETGNKNWLRHAGRDEQDIMVDLGEDKAAALRGAMVRQRPVLFGAST